LQTLTAILECCNQLKPGSTAEWFEMSSKWPVLETLLSGLIGLTALAAGIAPLAVPVLLVVTALVAIANDSHHSGSISTALRGLGSQPAVWAAGPLMILAFASSAWAYNPSDAMSSVLRISAVLAATAYVCASFGATLGKLDLTRQIRFVRALPIGAMLVFLYYCIDYSTKFGLTLFIANAAPRLFESDKYEFVHGNGGLKTRVNSFYFIRSAMATTALLPALAASLQFWPRPEFSFWLQVLALIATSVLGYISGSQSTQVALAGGLLFFIGATLSKRAALISAQCLFLTLALFALPLAALPKSLGLDETKQLPLSFRQRVVIWDNVAHIAQENWIYGTGVKSIKYGLPNPGSSTSTGEPATTYQIFHPHNGYLQIWLELGVFGATLFAASGTFLMRRISLLPTAMQKYVIALSAVTTLSLATGWGIWQPWLSGSLCFGWLCMLVVRVAFDRTPAATRPQ
jgi:O-antigen ligase